MTSLLHIKRLIYCPFSLQVPVDYTWANEILDHELPGLFKRRKSQSGSETVSSAILKLCSPLCITFVSLFRCSMTNDVLFLISWTGYLKSFGKSSTGSPQWWNTKQWMRATCIVCLWALDGIWMPAGSARWNNLILYNAGRTMNTSFLVKFLSPFLKVSVLVFSKPNVEIGLLSNSWCADE